MNIRFDFSDSAMSPSTVQTLDEHNYIPAYLVGYCGSWWFDTFTAVGPSPAPYKMKVCIRDDGIVFAPDIRMRSGSFCTLRKVCHIDDLPSHAIEKP